MGFFVASNPPILKELPTIPEGYRWRFKVVGTKIIGPPILVTLLQKRQRFWWTTVGYQPCSAPTLPCAVQAANIIYDNFGDIL